MILPDKRGGTDYLLGFPGTKDVRQHPLLRHLILSRWVWKFYHFRLTRPGRWLLGLTAFTFFVFALYGTIETQTFVPAAYALFLWLAALPAFLRPPRLQIEVRHAERTVAGEALPVEIEVRNTGRKTLYDLTLWAWGLPTAVDSDEDGVPVGTLRAGESARLRLALHCRQRGVYTLAGYRLASDFPFGLLYRYAIVPRATALIVHPDYRPLAHLDLPVGRRFQPGGIALSAPTGDSFEYQGNRPWREGDNPRDVDWRATARLMGSPDAPPIVREWREEYFLRVGVVLDTHQPSGGSRAVRQVRAETLERAIRVCAAVSDALAARDYVVDIFAAGPTLYHLTAGRGLAYREQILDILACVEGSPDEPLSVLAPHLAEDLPRLTTVVCILLADDAPRRAFIEGLRAQGVGVRAVVVAESEAASGSLDPQIRVLTPSAIASGSYTL